MSTVTPSCSNNEFHISIWPILLLNGLTLFLLSLFCLLFVLINGGFDRTLSELEIIIISYFGGIGLLTLIAASWLAWLGGPVVTLDATGISIESTWLMDKTFPERHTFQMSWENMATVSQTRFLTMDYLKIESRSSQPSLYIPLFLSRKKDCLSQLKNIPPKDHPLPQFLASLYNGKQ